MDRRPTVAVRQAGLDRAAEIDGAEPDLGDVVEQEALAERPHGAAALVVGGRLRA